MQCGHTQASNTYSNILSVTFLHQQIQSSQSGANVSGYVSRLQCVCAAVSTTCKHTLIIIGPVKDETS